MKLPRWFAFGLLLPTLVGCGAPTGTVEGAVSVDGEPITFGTVAFITSDGATVSTMIQPDGRYRVEMIPPGDVVATVHTYQLPPQVAPPDSKPITPAQIGTASYVPIPDIYNDHERSPLRTSVKPGPQTFDLKLTRK